MANKRVSLKGKGADLFFGDYNADQLPSATGEPDPPLGDDNGSSPDAPTPRQGTSRATTSSTHKPATKSSNPAVGRSVDRSTKQSTSQSTITRNNKIVDRPKAFYITERLDARIDDAVRYFQQVHGLRKVDRSTVLNAMMDNDEEWTDEALDQLVDRLISQLTSRLTGR